MIVKFLCENGSVRVFETDEISLITEPIVDVEEFTRLYEAIKMGDYQLFEGTPETIMSDQHGRVNPFRVMQFYDNKEKQRTVLFDNVVFIMNNQGKTVDTIYGY